MRATDGLGLLQLKLFEANTEAKLSSPTFIIAHPTDVSPLAAPTTPTPAVTDRFELFITGREICNGWRTERPRGPGRPLPGAGEDAGDEGSDVLRRRLHKGLEYGLPPTAGEGIGIDRLALLFTNSPGFET